MPQFLAIEWDSAECRAAVASIKGRQVVIEQAFAFPRGAGEESPDGLGEKLAKELDARGCGKPETMVCVGRTRIELRQFTVPPAEEDDLPDLVRFQASREFNELDDRWRLDFLPIETGGEGPKPVLATAIAPSEIAAIEKVCEVAGLTLNRVLLRPCEAASLLTATAAGGTPQLLIELFADEADLTVIHNGKTVFLRTTRFAGGRPAVPALVAEIRLTLAAARNQLVTESGESAKIDSLVLFGKEAIDVQLAESVKSELGFPVALVDPFAGLKTSSSLATSMPVHAERYAPLLGMLQAELRNTRHAIDFINPRKRPPPRSRKNLWVALAATAGVLVVGWIVWGRIAHIMLASEVKDLTDQVTAIDNELNAAKKPRMQSAEFRKWVDQDVVWLDEISGLSRGMPPAHDVMLGEFNANSGPLGSQIDIRGWTNNYATIAKMEEGVRTLAGKMNTTESQKDDKAPSPYVWRFDAIVKVDREPGKEGSSAAPRPAAEKQAEKQVAEKPVAEKPVAEKPVAEKPAAEKPAAAPSSAAPPRGTGNGSATSPKFPLTSGTAAGRESSKSSSGSQPSGTQVDLQEAKGTDTRPSAQSSATGAAR
jgi:Tfp pilus assembly PilM family ATPase